MSENKLLFTAAFSALVGVLLVIQAVVWMVAWPLIAAVVFFALAAYIQRIANELIAGHQT